MNISNMPIGCSITRISRNQFSVLENGEKEGVYLEAEINQKYGDLQVDDFSNLINGECTESTRYAIFFGCRGKVAVKRDKAPLTIEGEILFLNENEVWLKAKNGRVFILRDYSELEVDDAKTRSRRS